MSRRKLAAAWTVVLSALMMPSIHAQDEGADPFDSGPALIPAQVERFAGESPYDGVQQSAAARQGDPAICQPPMAIDANSPSGMGGGYGGNGAGGARTVAYGAAIARRGTGPAELGEGCRDCALGRRRCRRRAAPRAW